MLKNNPSIAHRTVCDCIDHFFQQYTTIFFGYQDISDVKLTMRKNCGNNKIFSLNVFHYSPHCKK